jgi:hypothetical protein
MPANKLLSVIVSAAGLVALGRAQVLSPAEIRDPELKALEQKDFASLKKIGVAVTSHQFPYPFYLSRVLDITRKQEQEVDHRSIHFDTYNHQTVVEVTGNYFASYADTLNTPQRAQRTLDTVIEPILEAAVPAMADEPKFRAFAFEIGQHVRRQMLGVTVEVAENVEYFFPHSAVAAFLEAKTPAAREAVLLQGALFVNSVPAGGWERQCEAWLPAPKSKKEPKQVTLAGASANSAPEPLMPAVAGLNAAPAAHVAPATVAPATVAPATVAPPAPAPSPRSTAGPGDAALASLVHDLDKEAHFVPYAPPGMIPFRGGSYLQLSMKTTLQESDGGSQYRTAALAFDEHISHLIRGVLAHIPDRNSLDGVDFSTSIRSSGANSAVLSVEYLFPMSALACYEKYDCTGQQLINQGFVLINGERVSLELQSAEAAAVAAAPRD